MIMFFNASFNGQVFSYDLINHIVRKGKGAVAIPAMYGLRSFSSNIRSMSFSLRYIIHPTKVRNIALEDKGRVYSKYSCQQQLVLHNDFL